MSQVKISINEATVTSINEFNSFKGYGVDFNIEAQSSNGTVYLQVTVYDDDARYYRKCIHESDNVTVSGVLKVKPYPKNDGAQGTSLVIERPESFAKKASNKSDQQYTASDYEPENPY